MSSLVHYPAEWEGQLATWVAWPVNGQNWGSRKAEIEEFYTKLITTISRFQTVCALVPFRWEPSGKVARAFQNLLHIPQFFETPTNDIWIRDYGPLFVKQGRETSVVKFEFNAWGGKFPPWTQDNAVPIALARALGMALYRYNPILEGGALEMNGDGLCLTPRPCLYGKNRNRYTPRLVEKTLLGALGLDSLVVLERGLPGDHTDGHIDNVARFVSKTRVVMAGPYPGFAENKKQIETALRARYADAQVDVLPLPPQRQLGSETLPASYMNFIYANGAVLVPTYGCPQDAEALAYFASVHPDREVLGIDCSLVIEEGGSLHCLSKQQPL
jgi:agmatine deiminase